VNGLPERYLRRRQLGRGGMGEVLLVLDRERGEEVALKLLAPAPGADLAEARLLFAREYWTLAGLRHPNLVEVYDQGELADGTPYFTMAHVPGADLDRALGALPEAQVRGWLPGLLGALATLHAAGWVHGDLKPANLRLRADGQVTLMDLGLLRPAGRPAGAIRGSLLYLAPEAIAASAVDARADLYALGAVLYHLLAGRPPFAASLGGRAGWALPLLRAHLAQQPPQLRTAGVSPEMAGLIQRLLAKDPAARPAHVGEVLASLGLEPGPAPGASLLGTPLLGRSREAAALAAFLAGGAEALRLVGPPGSGKTRLLAEARARAQVDGAVLVALTGLGADAPAYEAWRAPLLALLAGSPAAAREQAAPVLARLWPQAEVEPAAPLEAQQERARLHLAVADLARATAPGAAWLVDDADRLDPASGELLGFLQRQGVGRWVLASHEGEGDLVLGPLDGEGLARALLGQDELPGPVAKLVVGPRQPGDVEGSLAAAIRAGALVRGPAGWRAARGRKLQAPPVETALTALSPEALDVARAAALLGSYADQVAVQAVAGLGDEAYFAALAEAEQAELVARDGKLVRSLRAVAAPAALHGAAGRWLATHGDRGGNGRDPADARSPGELAAIASLLLHGDEPAGAVPWVLAAARRAVALHAIDQAEKLVAPALALPALAPADLRALQALQGHVLRHRGRLDEALELYEHLLPAMREARDPGLAAQLVTAGLVQQMKGRYPQARAAFAEAIALAPQPEDEARACYAAARLAYFEGAPAAELGERALAAARRAGRQALVASILGFVGFLRAEEPAGMAMLAEAVALCEAQGDVMQEQVVLNSLGNAQLATGRHAEALATFTACRDRCERLGVPNELVFAHLNLGVAHLELGHTAEAAAEADRALALAREQGREFPAAFALAVGGHARVAAGEAAGLAAIAEGLALARRIGNAYAELGILVHQAEALAALGRVAEAREAARAARVLAEDARDAGALRKLAKLEAVEPAPPPAPDEADLAGVLQRTLTSFVALARAQRGFLLLYRGFELTYLLAVGASTPEDDAFSATLAHRVLWQGAPVWIDDLQQHAELAAAASVQALGLRAALGVPLEHGGEVIGVLLADTTDLEARFDPADLPAAVALGREAAAAIATARRLQAAQAEAQAARRLARLALAAAGAPDLVACWPAIADEALALTGATRALYLADPGLQITASRGPDPNSGFATAIAAWVREHGEPVHLLDAQQAGVRAVWAAPAGPGVLYLDGPREAADPAPLAALAAVAEVLGAVAGRGQTARSGHTNL
jgi:tetratricopeptide (TPR) repeat protein